MEDVLLGDVCDLIRGVTYKKEQAHAEPASGRIPILRAANIKNGKLLLDSDLVYVDESVVASQQFLQGGDIVLAMSSGSASVVGKSALLVSRWEGAFGAFCSVLRPRTVDPSFLFYRISARDVREKWSADSSGTNINNLKRQHILGTKLTLPTLEGQRRIVENIEEHFSHLDAAEAALRIVSAKLSSITMSVLAKKTGGAVSAPLGSALVAANYGTSHKTTSDGGGAPVLRIPNLRNGGIDRSGLKYLWKDTPIAVSHIAGPSDILIVRTNGSRNLIGRASAVGVHAGLAFASYLIRGVVDTTLAIPEYIVAALELPSTRANIEGLAASTAGQYNLSIPAIKSICVPLPSLEAQRDILRAVSNVREFQQKASASLLRARALRYKLYQSVLQAAFGVAS